MTRGRIGIGHDGLAGALGEGDTLRLGPHLDAMRETLADALGIAVDRVSVKARSNDGLGAEGRASATVAVLLGAA